MVLSTVVFIKAKKILFNCLITEFAKGARDRIIKIFYIVIFLIITLNEMFKLIVLADLNAMFISYIEIIVDMYVYVYENYVNESLMRQYA